MKALMDCKSRIHLIAGCMVCALYVSASSFAQEQSQSKISLKEDPFDILLKETRPLETIWQVDYRNTLELGVAYVSDNSVNFGEYTGLNNSSVVFLGNLNWQRKDNDQAWVVELVDVGVDSRAGVVEWKFNNNSVWLSFDSVVQIVDDSGSTPYSGSTDLVLPTNWEAGIVTQEFSSLENSSELFTRSTRRQKTSFGFDRELTQNWSLGISADLERKNGTGGIGAAIYTDAADPAAVLIPQPIDNSSTRINVNVNYSGSNIQWNTKLYTSSFTNNKQLLQWQNPYDENFEAAVNYPEGKGAIALAPDNHYAQARSTASFRLSDYWRGHIDASVGKAVQNEKFPQYSINPELTIAEALPRTSLNGEVKTNTFSAKLYGKLTRKLSADLRYSVIGRENNSPRDGYLYIRGDGSSQLDNKFTVYNTRHSNSKQTTELNLRYRLPKRTKLSANYQLEKVVRTNAAVKTTEEVRAGITLALQPFSTTSMRFNVSGSDLAAGQYQWDNSYFALFDSEIINETPDYQRYLNHPLLSQYQLSNRESAEINVNVTQIIASNWQVAFDGMVRKIDYDQSVLGLLDQQFSHSLLSLAYSASDALKLSAYISYDTLLSEQGGRSFGGGIERLHSDVYFPIAHASDPSRNWYVRSKDRWATVGFDVEWSPIEKLKTSTEYRFVDTLSATNMSNGGATDMDNAPLPESHSRMHHLKIMVEHAVNSDFSIKVGYQYYRDAGANWSKDAVQQNSINKVLTFGETLPNEVVHYLSTSVIYRW